MKISPKIVAQAIYEAAQGKSGGELKSVLERSARFLRDKRMLGKSKDVLGALQKIIDKRTGVVRMKVTTAKRMEIEERKKLENEIKEKYKAQTAIGEFFEKPELLGGIRIEIGDEVLDTTYQNKLRKLENFLIQEK
ncbi:MAG: F0F1 ATP synthase subunit delta [bacterium]|nr:F0F1 ATP synthase subunit delta [bacterium]